MATIINPVTDEVMADELIGCASAEKGARLSGVTFTCATKY